MTLTCTCGKSYTTKPSRVAQGRGKYCSAACAYKARKGVRPSRVTEFKKSEQTGVKNHNWKGDQVGYAALHDWVYRRIGKPIICHSCGRHDGLQWANRSHTYLRDLSDWIPLCRGCHKIYDSMATGVTFHKSARKWQAQLSFDGKNHYLGLYKTREEAKEVYSRALYKYGRTNSL